MIIVCAANVYTIRLVCFLCENNLCSCYALDIIAQCAALFSALSPIESASDGPDPKSKWDESAPDPGERRAP